MTSNEIEKALPKFLPNRMQLLRDMALLVGFAALVGPLLGPLVVSWINPTQAWGVGEVGDYSFGSILLWGLALLMFEGFFYTAWLIHRGKQAARPAVADEWWNRQG